MASSLFYEDCYLYYFLFFLRNIIPDNLFVATFKQVCKHCVVYHGIGHQIAAMKVFLQYQSMHCAAQRQLTRMWQIP